MDGILASDGGFVKVCPSENVMLSDGAGALLIRKALISLVCFCESMVFFSFGQATPSRAYAKEQNLHGEAMTRTSLPTFMCAIQRNDLLSILRATLGGIA